MEEIEGVFRSHTYIEMDIKDQQNNDKKTNYARKTLHWKLNIKQHKLNKNWEEFEHHLMAYWEYVYEINTNKVNKHINILQNKWE